MFAYLCIHFLGVACLCYCGLVVAGNTLLLPANASDPASMVASAMSIYETIQVQQHKQQ